MKRPDRRISIALGVSALLLVIGAYRSTRHKDPNRYREVTVTRGDIRIAVNAMGVIQPKNKVEIKPPINGRVEEALVKEGKKVRRGEVLAWMSSTERAAMLDAARAKDPAELKKWETLYRPTPILAPISGTVIERNVESGQSFTTQDAVFVVSDRLSVKAQVDETDIAQIRVGQRASIVVDAYPDQELQGVVEQVAFNSTTVNNVTTYEVDVTPDQAPPFVRSGMTASVNFAVDSKTGVLLVATEAVDKQKGEAQVLRKSADNDPEAVSIQIGLNDGKMTEVLNGLSEGDTVLISERSEAPQETTSNPFTPSPRGRRGKR